MTDVVGQGSGVQVKDDGNTVGVAATINFGGNLYVSGLSNGSVTVSSGGIDSGYFELNNVGIHTLSRVGVGTDNPTVPLKFLEISNLLLQYRHKILIQHQIKVLKKT